MGIRATFNDFQLSTRILLIASFVVGLLLLTGFTLTDVGVDLTLWGWDPKPDWLKRYNAEWFHNHAYIPNILAAATGFLIGAPVALTVLATFVSQREDKAALDRVSTITQIAWNQYRDAISDLCSTRRVHAMEAVAKRIQDIHDQTWHGFSNYGSDQSPEAFQQIVAFAKSQCALWSEALQDMLKEVGETSDLRLKWFAAVRDWNTLDQYVRLQRLERGLHWFHRELDSLLQERMVSDRHPMRTHTHYLVSEAADIDSGDLEALITHVTEHGYGMDPGSQLIAFMNPMEADEVSSFRNLSRWMRPSSVRRLACWPPGCWLVG